ncbi:MAG: metallophosphoesterase [Pseudomonadota bacterium]
MVRFCHLSDIHLPSMPEPAPGELRGKRRTGWANWQRKRRHESSQDLLDALVERARQEMPDHWAVTGDLVNIALEAEMQNAAKWLDALAPPENVSLVCGNHDAYVSGSLARAAKLWGPWLNAQSTPFNKAPDNWKAFDDLYPMVQRVGDVAIISVNTGKPTAPFRATGAASIAQLARLKKLLTKLGEDGLFRLVLLHHPPFPKATHRHKRMIGAGHFRKIISDAGAELILHGHTHLDTIEHIRGSMGQVPCLCVPAAAFVPGHKRPPAAFNRLNIDREGTAWKTELARIGVARDAAPNAPYQFQTLHTQHFVSGG